MARENKFASSGGAKETPPGKLMEMIVEDVITAKTMTFAQWHALSENPLVQAEKAPSDGTANFKQRMSASSANRSFDPVLAIRPLTCQLLPLVTRCPNDRIGRSSDDGLDYYI